MRTIKFRAWDKDSEIMFIPTDIKLCKDMKTWDIDRIDKDNSKNTICKNGENVILMKFTGLKDKNGKEIFEGDIVKIGKNKFLEYLNEGENYLIKFCQGSFCFEKLDGSLIFCGDDLEIRGNKYLKIKVIGNIYENPELLEDKK